MALPLSGIPTKRMLRDSADYDFEDEHEADIDDVSACGLSITNSAWAYS